ncbi:MAG: 2-oxoglutarate dehydrogenase E1 component [Tepidisphaerales bacterium]
MKPYDFATQANTDYVEQLYQQYRKDPQSVDAEWRTFFAGFELGLTTPAAAEGATSAESAGAESAGVGAAAEARPSSVAVAPTQGVGVASADGAAVHNGVLDLVHSYRELGHCEAQLDPLGAPRLPQPLLALSEFGMSEADLDRQVGSGGFLGPTDGTLRDLVAKLRTTYCGTLGVEFTHISNKQQRDWLVQQMEPTLNRPQFTAEEKRAILFQLVAAEEFENFLHVRYKGKKRFSLEGGESLIPLVNTLIDEGAPMGVENFVLGMAHRGRLNVLAHVMNKPYEYILSEFEGTSTSAEFLGDGDVKYHLGYRCERPYRNGKQVKISLQPNPSHLEFINPVVQGIVRAKQTYSNDSERTRFVPILLHGDAAFTGQGVVQETLCLSELPGFRTGGTVHVIVNNQIGFTTSPAQGRFTPYPTDIAKSIQAPIWHVNGDDPEAVVLAAKLAIAFRERFKQDAMIDLWCYRKYGHNETDEPTFTQPVMYAKIEQKLSPQHLYAKRLIDEGVITQADHDAMKAEVLGRLEAAYAQAKEVKPRNRTPTFGGPWSGLGRAPAFSEESWRANTSVPVDKLRRIADVYATVPPWFHVNPKVQSFFLKKRKDAVYSGKGIDFGCGEMLAFGSLLLEGVNVRMTGQDVERGTFSHRHAVLHDIKTDATYTPLNHLDSGNPAKLTIINSMLSECAVLGFEWGYAGADPRTLVIWEAQFGDFVNGAQVIIDQFIAAAESKWQQSNGLVMMLPHGYEGQGPEHSNAYMERFLSLCAEDNMQVVVPTNPAQLFHVLRRQMHRRFRKPLVLFTPKTLLKADYASSRIEEFADGGFEYVLDDPGVADRGKVTRLLLCTGKVYYSLAAARDKTRQTNVAVVRIEQLYPFPARTLGSVMGRYPNVTEVAWVQEEPMNRGAYGFIDRRIRGMLPAAVARLDYYGRDEAASPAVGSDKVHAQEEQELISAALNVPTRNQEVRVTARSEPATAKTGAVSD